MIEFTTNVQSPAQVSTADRLSRQTEGQCKVAQKTQAEGIKTNT